MMRPSGVICGVTRARASPGLNDTVVGAAGGAVLVRDLRALLDQRLLLVGGDHARARDDLAAVVGLQRGELEVDRLPLPRLRIDSASCAGRRRRPAGSR